MFANIEACKELNCSLMELENYPAYYRDWALAKVSAERRAEKYLNDRARRDSENSRKNTRRR